MKIGILSDTHKKLGRAKKVIDMLQSNEVDYIIHAGDIVQIEVLEYINSKNINYKAVYGNNDRHLLQYQDKFNLVVEPHYFYLKEKKIKLMHRPYYMGNDADITIFGHTHEVHTELKNNNLFLNPGEVCARDSDYSNFLILDIKSNKYKLKHFFRKIKSDIWNIKEIDLD